MRINKKRTFITLEKKESFCYQKRKKSRYISHGIYGSCLSYRRHLQIRRPTNKSFGIKDSSLLERFLNTTFVDVVKNRKKRNKKKTFTKKVTKVRVTPHTHMLKKTRTLTCVDGQPLIQKRVFC